MSDLLRAFLDDAKPGPWKQESEFDGDGLRRRRATVWLINDDGDSLVVEEDDVMRLVNAALGSPAALGEDG